MYNFRHRLLEHLVAEGYEVYVSAPFDEIYFQKLEEIGCHTIAIDLNAKGTNPLKEILLFAKYRKLLKQINPLVSITYTIKPNIYGSLAAQLCHIRHLPITTGLGYVFLTNNLTSKIAKHLYRIAFAKAQQVWFLNNNDMQTFRSMKLIDDKKIHQLNSEGVDTEHFDFYDRSDRHRETLKFLYVGRLLYDKGLGEFAEAAKSLKSRYPNIEFHIVGSYWKDNPSAIKPKTMQEWIKSGSLIYDDYTDDVRPFLHDADCMVLPSYREGMSCSLMEAASTGLPLVATDVPGCRELVRQGENGFLCKAKDTTSLTNALEQIINLPREERLKMGIVSRQIMKEKFRVEIIIEQYDRYLAALDD